MKTVTIKSSCNGDEQTRTVTFLRDGSPVAAVEVSYDEGFEWAAEYACDWCSYGKLPKVSTPVDIAPLDIPAFMRLVQRRRVLIHTLNQDTDRVDIDGMEEDATVISWYDDGAAVELLIRPDDTFVSDGETFTVHGVTFIIEQL